MSHFGENDGIAEAGLVGELISVVAFSHFTIRKGQQFDFETLTKISVLVSGWNWLVNLPKLSQALSGPS